MATKQLPVVAIVGRANVGKSSLFNRLLGHKQAITDDASGTTRDAVGGSVQWNGGHFRLLDTAGLESGTPELKEQIRDQIESATVAADVMLVVVDGTTMPTDQDRLAAKLALKSRKPVILVINKADKFGYQLPEGFERLGIKEMILVSAVQGQGSGDLLDAVVEHLPTLGAASERSDIRLALIGRPNVGKSSLLNGLAGKQQAIVSAAAGTTRDVRDIELRAHGQTITLLDTAGLRRRGKITPGVEKYSVTRTISAIEGADICVLVLDATELSVAGDHHLAGLIKDAGKGLIIVVNKWDLIDSEELSQGDVVRRLTRDLAFVPWAPVLFTSAVTGLHLTQLFSLAVEIQERRQTQIKTSTLNDWLGKVTREHPPAGLKNRQPHINYGTQVGNQPPKFLIFSTYADLIHFSYKRYLENSLREKFDFIGTPIEIEFRSKRQEKAKA